VGGGGVACAVADGDQQGGGGPDADTVLGTSDRSTASS
jgi:hypothetical protein